MTRLQRMANIYLELESMAHRIAVEHYKNNPNVDDMRVDYTWKRANFFLELAEICGDDISQVNMNPHELTMEFSLEVG